MSKKSGAIHLDLKLGQAASFRRDGLRGSRQGWQVIKKPAKGSGQGSQLRRSAKELGAYGNSRLLLSARDFAYHQDGGALQLEIQGVLIHCGQAAAAFALLRQ